MKKYFTFLLIVLIYIGCKKNNSSSEIIMELHDYPVHAIVENLTTKDEPKTPQEIIENYAASVLRLRTPLIFQIEGNFTGSENREIIGFYGTPELPGRKGDITEALCFVLDSNGESIDNAYAIDYMTWDFMDIRIQETEIDLSEYLGNYIIWKDQVIGCFGDFNQNGKDELYLFRYSALYFRPYFFEFNGNEFKKIIEFNSGDIITISGIDFEKKIIFLKDQSFIESMDYQKYETTGTYIWNETGKMYELLSGSELKYFRWNRNLEQYEEIER